MSWQHPQNGDDGPRIYGVYDAEATASVYAGYADPAAAHGWYEEGGAAAAGPACADAASGAPAYAPGDAPAHAYAPGGPTYAPDDVISTAPTTAVTAPDAGDPGDDSAIFVDGSGRRRRLMRRIAVGMGVACVVFLGVVVAGFFGSGPAGGPLPWGHGTGDGKAPRAEHTPSAPGATRPSTPAQPEDPMATGPSPSATASLTEGGGEPADKTTPEPATSSAPTTTAPAATAPVKGNATGNPGRGHGRGSTKGPN
ncbi:hypothetical protein OHA28_20885 [Streptomyces sp. NBC_00269]|uniref:hypothetical protein n=1 Tax=Streptomyces sp. NBC_00269 TaxID=2975696 RepID=UPI002E2C8DAC|nr:hypothetical protein [Streptomyces sp. NBC_00269]